MKKISIIALFAILGSYTYAQSNSLLVAGSIGYKSEPHEEHTRSTFTFTPKVGYQFNNHWTAGLYSNYNMTKHGDEDATSSFAIGPFLRYTKSFNDVFGFYTDFSGGYKSNTATEKNGYELGLTPAVYANIGKLFALTLSMGGINYSTLNSTGDEVKTFNLDLFNSIVPRIGIQKNFGL